MPHLLVISPGFQTTAQDLGRYGFAHFGISPAGAADRLSLRLGNLLVGNPENTPALEMTITGGTFEFESDSVVAITGSDFQPTFDGRPVSLWTSIPVKSGQKLHCGPTTSGARCYLCIAGGFEVPHIFGSASTHLQSGLGGHEGRALMKGDVLPIGTAHGWETHPGRRINPEILTFTEQRDTVRIVEGPQSDMFSKKMFDILLSSTYEVSGESNRMGLRLQGPKLKGYGPSEVTTEGVSLGAVQVPDDGNPIILFVEHQTTGGYPKIANVISADFHVLGQLKPRDQIRFEMVSLDRAWSILRQRESIIASNDVLLPV